jgi:hypothetical protein
LGPNGESGKWQSRTLEDAFHKAVSFHSIRTTMAGVIKMQIMNQASERLQEITNGNLEE